MTNFCVSDQSIRRTRLGAFEIHAGDFKPNFAKKSAPIVLCRIMAATLVGLLLLAAISMADKFDEENYGVKVQCTRTRRIFL